MKVLLVHPRLSVKGGGERVAIHSILAETKAGHEITLVSEEFDEASFEDFYGYNGLFEKVNRSYYPPFKPHLGPRALLYQRIAYHRVRIKRIVSRYTYDILFCTQDICYISSIRLSIFMLLYFLLYLYYLHSS